MTVLPAEVIEQMRLFRFDSIEVAGLGGIPKTAPTFLVQVALRGSEPLVVKAIGGFEEPFILLGRDVLNRHRIVLDGPQQFLEIG